MRSLGLFITTFMMTISASAGVVYEQMATDLKSLREGMQSSLARIEAKEDKIIEKTESENKGNDLIGYVIGSSSVRVVAFRLQGVLRLLNTSSELSAKKQKDIYSLFTEIKAIEDGIGKMDEALTTLKNATDKGASDKKISSLRKKADEQSKYIAKKYKDIGWFKEDADSGALEKIDFLQQMNPDQEANIIRTAMVQEIKSFKDEISNELLPGMRDQEFSHDSMEYNFHEFRRQIRWVAIYFSSLPGLFSLSPYTLEGLTTDQQEILQTYKGNKYAQIASENSPVTVDRYTFYLLAHFIQQAGDAKDVAEEHFKLIEAGVDSELDEKQFKHDMVKMMTDLIDSRIFDTLIDTLQ